MEITRGFICSRNNTLRGRKRKKNTSHPPGKTCVCVPQSCDLLGACKKRCSRNGFFPLQFFSPTQFRRRQSFFFTGHFTRNFIFAGSSSSRVNPNAHMHTRRQTKTHSNEEEEKISFHTHHLASWGVVKNSFSRLITTT